MISNLSLTTELSIYISIIFSIVILIQNYKQKLNINYFFKVSLKIIFSTIAIFLFTMLFKTLLLEINPIITYPSYTATLIDFELEEDEEDEIRKIPIYNFVVDDKNITLRVTSISTDLFIGNTIQIFHKNGENKALNSGYAITIIAILIGLSILLTIISIIFLKENREKILIYLVRFILFIVLPGIIFAISLKLMLYFQGKIYIPASMIFALFIFLFILFIGWKFSIEGFSIENENEEVPKVKRNFRGIKTKKIKKFKTKKQTIEELDLNLGFMIFAAIFAFIFSILGWTNYIDEGVNPISLIFSVIGIIATFLTIRFYLAYHYFKTLSLKLLSPIKNGSKLKGKFLFDKKIKPSTRFTVILTNSHSEEEIDDEGDTYDSSETIWELKSERYIKHSNERENSIDFNFLIQNYKKGKLSLTLKATVTYFSFSRIYTIHDKED